MNFAICNETFQDWPLDRALGFAADCGYTGIEIAPFTIAPYVTEITPKARAEIRALAEKEDLDVVGLHWLLAKTEGFHITSPVSEVRRRTADYLADLARCCADLGGKILVFGSPQQRKLMPGVSPEQGMDYAAEVFQSVLPVLEETDVVVALEPLGPEETNFLVTASDAVELIDRIGSPHVRLHLDCKAMATETATIPELIQQHCRIRRTSMRMTPIGRGLVSGISISVPSSEALGKIDYRGWVSVEVFD